MCFHAGDSLLHCFLPSHRDWHHTCPHSRCSTPGRHSAGDSTHQVVSACACGHPGTTCGCVCHNLGSVPRTALGLAPAGHHGLVAHAPHPPPIPPAQHQGTALLPVSSFFPSQQSISDLESPLDPATRLPMHCPFICMTAGDDAMDCIARCLSCSSSCIFLTALVRPCRRNQDCNWSSIEGHACSG